MTRAVHRYFRGRKLGPDEPTPPELAALIDRGPAGPTSPLGAWIGERVTLCRSCPHYSTAKDGACALLANCRPCRWRALVRSAISRCPDDPPRWTAYGPDRITRPVPT